MNIIPTAFAATGTAAGHPSPYSSLWILVIFVVFIYFLMIRPQTKRAKQHRNMVSSLKTGDEIMSSGGLLGKIKKIDEHFISVSVSENVVVALQKSSVASVLPKGTIKF